MNKLLKYLCYQHQTWYEASGDRDTHFYYKWARSDEKHGCRQAKCPWKGRGLANIGCKMLTVFPIVTKLGKYHQKGTKNTPKKRFWDWHIGGATAIPRYSRFFPKPFSHWKWITESSKITKFQTVTTDSYFQLETPFKLENIQQFLDFLHMIQLFNPIQTFQNIQRFLKLGYNGSQWENPSNSLIFTHTSRTHTFT